MANPKLTDDRINATFAFKTPTMFDLNGKQIALKEIAVTFRAQVQWLAQTVQIDATEGIYDYVRGRARLTPGKNSYVIQGVDFNRARPLSSAPDAKDLGFGLIPGEIDFQLASVGGLALGETPNEAAELDDLIKPGDLSLQIT